MSQIFGVKFQIRDINIFVHRGVISVLHFQVKSGFSSEKKHPWENLRFTFVEKMLKVKRSKIKENSVADRTWSSAKLLILINGTAIGDRDVPLTAQNQDIAQDIFSSR